MANVLAVLEECGAYVDDAASFPEQFKPGLVKRHQREYNEARAAVEQLAVAAWRALAAAYDNGTFSDDMPQHVKSNVAALTSILADFHERA